MMRILIIGSKGFIGSYAYKYFSNKENTECWGCDVVVDYNEKQYILLDAINSDFHDPFEMLQFDVCINCSGAASVPDSFKNPQRDFNLNVYTVVKILDAIRKHAPSCRFVNLSSAAVYGNPRQLPVKESDPCSPVSPYGFHKQFAENICLEYHTYFQLKTCSLRIFSAYGPGLSKQLLWDIYQKTIASESITLFGSGQETRDFIYIHDLIFAIDKIVENGTFDGAIYNVANGVEISILNLATILIAALNFKGSLSFSGDNRTGDPVNWQADISKLQNLGYEQKYSIEEGIKNFAGWVIEKK